MAAGLATHIWNNKLKTVVLLAGFPVLLAGMVGAFFFAYDLWWQAHPDMRNIVTAYNIIGESGRGIDIPPALANYRPDGSMNLNHALGMGLYGMLNYAPYAFGVALIWFAIAFFAHASLMRMASGSQPVTRQQMPKLYNLLENLCISRGIPMPKFEVIDSPALNAFATGINESTYKIVVTRGLIERLSDDELEAVIAHELTHIMNQDVRLLIVAVIFVGMLSFMAEMAFRTLLHGRRPNYYARRDDRNSGGQLIVVLIAAAILALGYVFAVLIRFAISRKREFLADAGAVDLTKNPAAMMRALQRISGQDKVQGMPDEVQQMCIENSHNFMGIFATHPPIAERIRVLSQMTNTPIPQWGVDLSRGPRRPWDHNRPPDTPGSYGF
ncbi:MAG: M48 family metallopeptidase [Alphaproteobacteria bacterium]